MVPLLYFYCHCEDNGISDARSRGAAIGPTRGLGEQVMYKRENLNKVNKSLGFAVGFIFCIVIGQVWVIGLANEQV